MSDISSELVKELRNRTGAGMMDCKAALKEANGSMDAAIEVLRKKGLKNIGKRAGKVASEGVIGSYVHAGDQVAVVVELNSETDFVARSDDFRQLAKDIALHIAAMKPLYPTVEDVPASVVEKEKEIALAQLNENQRKNADKILPGKLEKFFEDTVLLKQIFVRDDSGTKTIKDLIEALSMKVGEKIVVRRFVRFEVGEGIEKSDTNFAAEVAQMAGV
ncbi:MAG: translation elongation factor Ts [Proteobacteria bacterium]|nr:translation elongation factor Ts [Pseudomonadota bacterium]